MKKLLLTLLTVGTLTTSVHANKYKTCSSAADCPAGQVCRKEIIQVIGENGPEAREEYVCAPAGAELKPGATFPQAEYAKDLA